MDKDITKESAPLPFEVYSAKFAAKISGVAFGEGRYLIGRAESCDITIHDPSVSSVHAVVEVKGQTIKIYDMNSTNGTFLGERKVIADEVKPDQKIKLGDVEFTFRRYNKESSLPPPLAGLDPQTGEARVRPSPPPLDHSISTGSYGKTDVARVLPQVSPDKDDEGPFIIYPLAADPKAEFSEYIFEDVEELRPIFRYELGKQAVEVMILFQDRVYLVEHVPIKNGVIGLVGSGAGKNEIEFPYLRKEEKVPLFEIKKEHVTAYRPLDFDFLHLSDATTQKVEKHIDHVSLGSMDIVKFQRGGLEIYLRNTSAPPKVKGTPFFDPDKQIIKHFLFFFFLFFTPLGILSLLDISDEVKKEKAPERLATILYKKKLYVSKNKPIEKTKKAPKKVQKSPKQVAKPKPKPKPKPKKTVTKTKKTSQATSKVKKTSKTVGQKTAKKVQNSKRRTSPNKSKTRRTVRGKTANRSGKARSASRSRSQRSQSRKANRPSPNKGTVDVYQNNRFKSAVSSLMAKGGSLKGARVSKSGGSGNLRGASVSGGSVKGLKTADVSSDVGNLTGATEGKLEAGRGAEGLVGKKSIYTAGVPSQTVVVGSIDPDTIRRILRQHLPQFRYCYQKALDRSSRNNTQGVLKLAFTIGASGRVSKAGLDGGTSLPGSVSGCVINVLRGIRFPAPRGGGRVDVRQPLNFYPQRI